MLIGPKRTYAITCPQMPDECGGVGTLAPVRCTTRGLEATARPGPHEVTIATNRLGRRPHCQTEGDRSPTGIAGAIVDRSTLLTDPELREFPTEKPRGELSAKPDPMHIQPVRVGDTPPLQHPLPMTTSQRKSIAPCVASVPPEDTDYDPEALPHIRTYVISLSSRKGVLV